MSVSKMILILSWISLFGGTWLMIFRIIPRNDLFSWGMFLGYLILAFLSAAYMSADRGNK